MTPFGVQALDSNDTTQNMLTDHKVFLLRLTCAWMNTDNVRARRRHLTAERLMSMPSGHKALLASATWTTHRHAPHLALQLLCPLLG